MRSVLSSFPRGAAVVFLALSAASAFAACDGTEGDRIVWARERMFPAATKTQTELVYQWLVNSTRSCSLSGDLWYYRGITARKLGNGQDATYAFRKADENSSKAKTDGFDPFSLGGATRVSSPARIKEKYALLVGIHRFNDKEKFLRYSAKDAKDLGELLVSGQNFKKENVTVLLDENATTDKIREAFGDIRAKAKPDDLVVIFISSHGFPRDLDPTGISYVETYDFDESKKSTLFSKGLKMVELAEFGRWTLANNYVLILDTCYAGAAQPGVAGQVASGGASGLDPLQGLQGSANRVVISASQADEQSIEDDASHHGLFTRFLLDGLRQKGNPDLTAVFKSLQPRVTEEAEKENRPQHPVMLNYGEGAKISLGAPLVTAALDGLLSSPYRLSFVQ